MGTARIEIRIEAERIRMAARIAARIEADALTVRPRCLYTNLQNRRNFFAYFRRTETKARRARGEEREKNNQLGSQVHI